MNEKLSMKTCRRPTLNITKLIADLRGEGFLRFFRKYSICKCEIKPVYILVNSTPFVDEGKVVFVHQVLEQKVNQACEVRGD